jgi:hypothetical protein
LEPTLSLKFYAIRINEHGKPGSVKYFNDIVYQTLEECLADIAKPANAKAALSRMFAIVPNTISRSDGADRHISGVVRAGTSGYSSEILEKAGAVAFQREPNHTEVLPYYFYASVPKADRSPIICIQQISGNGLYLLFASIFMERLRDKLKAQDIVVRLNPIYLNALYISQFYENGVVRKITAIQRRLASDNADDAREARIASELNLSPVKQNQAIATLKELLTRNGKITTDRKQVFENIREIFELEVDAAAINELIVEAELNGVKRKLAIGADYGTAFDVTGTVPKKADGHPDPAKMEIYVREFLRDSIRPYYRGH